MMITEEAIVAASDGLETAELDGEAVVLDINSGLYYGLSAVGAEIMALLASPIRVNQIILTLKEEYDVSGDQISRDVLTFLDDMLDRNLIQITTGEVA